MPILICARYRLLRLFGPIFKESESFIYPWGGFVLCRSIFKKLTAQIPKAWLLEQVIPLGELLIRGKLSAFILVLN